MTQARQPSIQVVAHRGASEDAPEHTLAAYKKAIEDGADALECDVRLTADGHLVCVHDRRVNRTSNGRGAVSALELADLATLDFGSWMETMDSEESPDWKDRSLTSVLTLERLLELIADTDRRIELAIETKHPTRWAGQVEERLLQMLARFGLDGPAPGESPVRIMSFSARSLHRIADAAPQLPTVYLMQFVSPRLRDGGCGGSPDRGARHPHRAQSAGLCGTAAQSGPPCPCVDGERTGRRRTLRESRSGGNHHQPPQTGAVPTGAP